MVLMLVRKDPNESSSFVSGQGKGGSTNPTKSSTGPASPFHESNNNNNRTSAPPSLGKQASEFNTSVVPAMGVGE